MSTLSKMDIKVFKYNTSQKFEILAGINRPIKPKHVQEMAKSVKELGCIRPVLVSKIKFIDGVEKLYIIDGQHLFHALLKLELDIPTLEVEVVDMRDLIHTISVLNNTSAPWGLEDYVKAWGNLGDNKDYRTLQEVKKRFGMTYTLLAMAMNTELESAGLLRHIKKGNFTIDNEKLGREILIEISEVKKYIPKGYQSALKVLMAAFIKFYKDNRAIYNQARMIKFISANIFDLTNTYSPTECLALLRKCKMS